MRALRLMFGGIWQHRAAETVEDVLREHFDYDLDEQDRRALADRIVAALVMVECPVCGEQPCHRECGDWIANGDAALPADKSDYPAAAGDPS